MVAGSPCTKLFTMPVQDDAREIELVRLFNLTVPASRSRADDDAFLKLGDDVVPFELKSTTSGSISTVRDFGPDHITKWKGKHWLFGFYDKSGAVLQYCCYGSPQAMAPWIESMELYVRPDVVLAEWAPRMVDLETVHAVLGEKPVYTRADAKRIHKKQWRDEQYAAAEDVHGGYSPTRMTEILQQRCSYVIRRGATLNNPHIPKGYFSGWERITEDHAARLRELVKESVQASDALTAEAME